MIEVIKNIIFFVVLSVIINIWVEWMVKEAIKDFFEKEMFDITTYLRYKIEHDKKYQEDV